MLLKRDPREIKISKIKRKSRFLYLTIGLFFIFLYFWFSHLRRYFKGNFGEELKYLFYLQFGSPPLFSQYFDLFLCITTFFSLKSYKLYGTKWGHPMADEIVCTFKEVSLSSLLGITFVFLTSSSGLIGRERPGNV